MLSLLLFFNIFSFINTEINIPDTDSETQVYIIILTTKPNCNFVVLFEFVECNFCYDTPSFVAFNTHFVWPIKF